MTAACTTRDHLPGGSITDRNCERDEHEDDPTAAGPEQALDALEETVLGYRKDQTRTDSDSDSDSDDGTQEDAQDDDAVAQGTISQVPGAEPP